MERQRRGCGEKLRKPVSWKEFLTNDENKKQLIQVLLKVWSSSEGCGTSGIRKVTAICEDHAYQLEAVNRILQ
jgi:hypothetical protein